MRASKMGLLVGMFLVQFVAHTQVGWTQASRPLQNRIPKPNPTKYGSVQDAKQWKNPYLIVRPDGIEIIGTTPVGGAITVESVPGVLGSLPDSAWPYSLVVAVQDIGILSGKAELVRIAATRTKLLNLLRKLGIAVDRWPSA
jgi:hypothetical protein